jgi:hypothetical protein
MVFIKGGDNIAPTNLQSLRKEQNAKGLVWVQVLVREERKRGVADYRQHQREQGYVNYSKDFGFGDERDGKPLRFQVILIVFLAQESN